MVPILCDGDKRETASRVPCDASTATLHFVCDVGAVPSDGAIKVESGDMGLAVFNIDGTIYVIDDACTHGPGSLSEGFICGTTVTCDFHNGAFDICTGAAKAPPCVDPVRTYAVTIADGKVFIDPARPAAA